MKIDFQFETPYGNYSDSLWFDDLQPIPSDVEIEAMKQKRLNDWLDIFKYPVMDTPSDLVA